MQVRLTVASKHHSLISFATPITVFIVAHDNYEPEILKDVHEITWASLNMHYGT